MTSPITARHRRLLLGAALLGLAGASQAAPAKPMSAAETDTLRRAQAHEAQQATPLPGEPQAGEHVARRAVHPSQLPLRNAESLQPRRARIGEATDKVPAQPLSKKLLAARALQQGGTGTLAAATAATAANCSGSDFVGKSGAALLGFIDNASLRGCMYTLYSGSVAQYRTVFSDANIITVAN